MRIAFFVNPDQDFLLPALDAFLRVLRERGGHEAVGLLSFPDRLGKHRGLDIPLYYLRLLGPFGFIRLLRRILARRLAARARFASGRGLWPTFPSLCRHHGLPFDTLPSPNSRAATAWVKERRVDCLIISLGQVLKKRILRAPWLCVLNKHAALLPAHRGLLPVFWAKLAGDPVGVTIHEVAPAIDAGPVVVQERCEGETLSVFDHYDRIFRRVPALLLEALDVMAGAADRRVVEPPLPESYFGLPTSEDYRAFRAAGLRFA